MKTAYYNLLHDVLRGYDRCTPSKIVSLRNNQIFVFGTNKYGSQKHGAAGLAAKSFGAQVGITSGPTGRCYALPTMGVSFDDFSESIKDFEDYVRSNLEYTFLVTPVGCGHAGFDVCKVAKLFIGLVGLKNVMLPEIFLSVYRSECRKYLNPSSSESTKIDSSEDCVYQYYSECVHKVIHYLMENNIPFNKEGGYSLLDNEGKVLAEAELGIDNDKIVFYPFNTQSELVFRNNGYSIYTEEEFLNLKIKK
jgi:hypothetical protein